MERKVSPSLASSAHQCPSKLGVQVLEMLCERLLDFDERVRAAACASICQAAAADLQVGLMLPGHVHAIEQAASASPQASGPTERQSWFGGQHAQTPLHAEPAGKMVHSLS